MPRASRLGRARSAAEGVPPLTPLERYTRALHGARDQLNSTHHGLHVVAVGSHKAMVATMCKHPSHPFFCAMLESFPLLGMDFVSWFCDQLHVRVKLDPIATYDLFQRTGCRPELLFAAADLLRDDFPITPAEMQGKFAVAVQKQAVIVERADNLTGRAGYPGYGRSE